MLTIRFITLISLLIFLLSGSVFAQEESSWLSLEGAKYQPGVGINLLAFRKYPSFQLVFDQRWETLNPKSDIGLQLIGGYFNRKSGAVYTLPDTTYNFQHERRELNIRLQWLYLISKKGFSFESGVGIQYSSVRYYEPLLGLFSETILNDKVNYYNIYYIAIPLGVRYRIPESKVSIAAYFTPLLGYKQAPDFNADFQFLLSYSFRK
jgi:hypothetical protein